MYSFVMFHRLYAQKGSEKNPSTNPLFRCTMTLDEAACYAYFLDQCHKHCKTF